MPKVEAAIRMQAWPMGSHIFRALQFRTFWMPQRLKISESIPLTTQTLNRTSTISRKPVMRISRVGQSVAIQARSKRRMALVTTVCFASSNSSSISRQQWFSLTWAACLSLRLWRMSVDNSTLEVNRSKMLVQPVVLATNRSINSIGIQMLVVPGRSWASWPLRTILELGQGTSTM